MTKPLLKSILNTGLSGHEKMVLTVLWAHADKNGECYPSIPLITKMSSWSRAKVFEIIKGLEFRGAITKHDNPDGKTTLYKIQDVTQIKDADGPQYGPVHSVDGPQHRRLKGPQRGRIGSTAQTDGVHSVDVGGPQHGLAYIEEDSIEGSIEGSIEKTKAKKDYEKTFDELWDEVRDKPFLEQMAYITKGHPAARDRFRGIIISAVDYVGYRIIKDHEEDCLKRKRNGETLNDWDEGILRGEWYYKGLFLEHYQHRQNAEHLILGEPIPEESKAYMHYYQMAFDEFIKRCRNLFSQYQEKATDPDWAHLCHQHGDGPWITRKYTSS